MSIAPISSAGTTSPAPVAFNKVAEVPQPASVVNEPPTAIQTEHAPTPVQELQRAVSILNELIAPVTSSVSFKIDDSTGKTVIRVMDTDTNTLIRQFPSEEALALTRFMDAQQGLILNTQA